MERHRAIVRKQTRSVRVGSVSIGGEAPISIQSMLKTDPHNRRSSLRELRSLENVGCELVRMAIPDEESMETFSYLKARAKVPLVADVHFQHQLALEVMKRGADKVRINPGNLSSAGLRKVIEAARSYALPLRVGFNSGSLPRELKARSITSRMQEAVRNAISLIQSKGLDRVVFSLKAASIDSTLHLYRWFSSNFDYPLHIGLTEAGPIPEGIVKSVLACESLLLEGIGDTLRISLTASAEDEVRTARALLSALHLREEMEVISCPTCGRTHAALPFLLKAIRSLPLKSKKGLVVAVMGCEVNGPGEAAHADLGLALTANGAVLFSRGKIVRKLQFAEVIPAITAEIEKWNEN